MDSDLERPLRLVHCSNDIGHGHGMATINRYLYQNLDRNLFEPVMVATTDLEPHEVPYRGNIPYVFVSQEKRFETLVHYFKNADIVQFYGAFDPVVCEAVRLTKVPVLVELLHMMEKGQGYDFIDASICCSRFIRDYQPSPGNIICIPNAIDLKRFHHDPLAKDPNKIVLIQVARSNKKMYFNLDDLAGDILPIDPRIEIWMVGPGYERPSNGRVKYWGYRDDVDRLLRQADVFVHLADKEPFGLVVAEAMASGCIPVVANDGGPAEIVSHENDGWVVDGGDRSQIIESLRRVIALKGTAGWDDLQSRGQHKVQQRFTIKSWIEKHQSVYLDLVNKKGRRERTAVGNFEPSTTTYGAQLCLRYIYRQWDFMGINLEKMIACPKPIESHFVQGYLIDLIVNLFKDKFYEYGILLFKKLFESHASKERLINVILEYCPDEHSEKLFAQAALEVFPAHPASVILLINHYLNEKQIESALNLLGKSLIHSPDSPILKDIHRRLEEKTGARDMGTTVPVRNVPAETGI